MEEQLIAKYEAIISKLKDGKSVKIRRETILKGKDAPFGTLTRVDNLIKFEPARRVPGYAASWDESKAAKELMNRELLSAFHF